jgi:hypothetical protein
MGSKRVELFAAIRFDWQRNRLSIRSLARKYDVHRRTVRQAIASPLPPDRKTPVRAAPVREAVTGWIDEMLREDLAATTPSVSAPRPCPPSSRPACAQAMPPKPPPPSPTSSAAPPPAEPAGPADCSPGPRR